MTDEQKAMYHHQDQRDAWLMTVYMSYPSSTAYGPNPWQYEDRPTQLKAMAFGEMWDEEIVAPRK
jgi:hypothetical protein